MSITRSAGGIGNKKSCREEKIATAWREVKTEAERWQCRRHRGDRPGDKGYHNGRKRHLSHRHTACVLLSRNVSSRYFPTMPTTRNRHHRLMQPGGLLDHRRGVSPYGSSSVRRSPSPVMQSARSSIFWLVCRVGAGGQCLAHCWPLPSALAACGHVWRGIGRRKPKPPTARRAPSRPSIKRKRVSIIGIDIIQLTLIAERRR